MRRAFALLAVLPLAGPLTAQERFRADLDGAQLAPPVATNARAWATVQLQADLSLSYRLEALGLAGTEAHLHLGAPGASSPILATLGGGPSSWSGVTPPLASADADALRAGGAYFDVHSALHPAGEIRGQLAAAPTSFAAFATGAQQTPPNASAATASGVFTVNPDRTLSYEIHATGILSTATEIHVAAPGMPGPRIFNFGGGAGPWIGVTAPMTTADFADFQAGLAYLNVHSTAYLLGEIRGQIYATGEAYGAPCGGAGGRSCRLSAAMVPYSGAEVRLLVRGGEASGAGTLILATAPSAAPFGGCALYLAQPVLRALPVQLDAAGAAEIPVHLPVLPADRSFFLQFGGHSGGSLTYASNALELTVQVL